MTVTKPRSPQLPQDRVSSQTPFSMTGVDFAGPLYVQVTGQSMKTYVCMFTYGSTQALHLALTYVRCYGRFWRSNALLVEEVFSQLTMQISLMLPPEMKIRLRSLHR